MLTLSLIIPVYNEERHIRECLDSIALQDVMPDEVIVVDNNCTDTTIDIARTYKFVTVIKESHQGRGHARSAGFDMASGDIIARVDADSRLDRGWVALVKQDFADDKTLMGITGLGRTSIFPIVHHPRSTLASRAYFWFAHAGFGTITMWGANMAIRASAWRVVRDKTIRDDRIVHEDQDVSLWMAAQGMKIRVNHRLRITTNGQTYRYFPKLLHYSRLYESTKRIHAKNGNLSSTLLPRLGFWETLPGRIGAFLCGVYFVLCSLLPFPLDFFIYRILKRQTWFD